MAKTKPSVEIVKCACRRCSNLVKTTDYTYPECPKCFVNIDGRCA